MVPKILGYSIFKDDYRNYLEFDIEFPDIFSTFTGGSDLNYCLDKKISSEDISRFSTIHPKKKVRVNIMLEIIFFHSKKYITWRQVYYFACATNNIKIPGFEDRRKMRLRDPEKFLEDVLDHIKDNQLVSYFDALLIWYYRTRIKTTKEN